MTVDRRLEVSIGGAVDEVISEEVASTCMDDDCLCTSPSVVVGSDEAGAVTELITDVNSSSSVDCGVLFKVMTDVDVSFIESDDVNSVVRPSVVD